MKNTTVFDEDLNPVLELSDNSELEPLVGYLKEKYSEQLTDTDVYVKHSPNHEKYADLIAKELRDMGGNSFANAVRREGPKYHEIVCDVASKLKAPYNKNKDVSEIENSILETILTKALDEMSTEDKEKLMKVMGGKSSLNLGGASTAAFITLFKSGGFYSYQLTLIVANQVARFILGKGLQFATNATITRVAGILAGPVGWAISGLWTAVDIAGPAYKVTIPSVVHVAMLRKKHNSLECSNCDAMFTDTTIRFCPECGHSIFESTDRN